MADWITSPDNSCPDCDRLSKHDPIIIALTPEHERYAAEIIETAKNAGVQIRTILCGYHSVVSDSLKLRGFTVDAAILEIIFVGRYGEYRNYKFWMGEPYGYSASYWIDWLMAEEA